MVSRRKNPARGLNEDTPIFPPKLLTLATTLGNANFPSKMVETLRLYQDSVYIINVAVTVRLFLKC